MKVLVIAIVYTLLLAAGECQNKNKSPSTAVNSSCGNTYTYTMNVGDVQSSVDPNDEVKKAVKTVVEELLERKMEAVINRLEEKISNSTEEVRIQMKADLKELKGFANDLANQSQQQLQDLLNELKAQQMPSSCKDLPLTSPSGYYWIYNSTGYINYQFCDMTRKCGCNGTGRGWMRVANLDMTDPNQQCPDELRLITSPRRTCGRVTPVEGCASVVYPTNGYRYSQICGKIKAYQFGQPEAFDTVNTWLIDGISLYTRRQSQHIWSFVVGHDEVTTGTSVCPCNVGHSGITINTTIGQDYFCDTGSETRARSNVFHSEDPLWDGTGCSPRSTCCSFNNPPWFCKQLPQPTTDDIELQMCGYNPITNEDTPIEIVEIYIQ